MNVEIEPKIQPGTPRLIERNPVDFIETPGWAKTLRLSGYLPETVTIADPLSYCAGVEQAVEEVERKMNRRLYHVPIHNERKLEEWEAGGAVLVDNIEDVPDGEELVFSAHGVSNEVKRRAKEKRLIVADTTCPLVDKTRREVRALNQAKYKIILVGDKKHDEMVGTLSEAPDAITIISPKAPPEKFQEALESLKDEPLVAVRTQTTLEARLVDKLLEQMEVLRPDINKPLKSDICYATQNRQDAVIETIRLSGAGLMIIFGSGENSRTPSSNSMRLREVGQGEGVPTYLVEDISEIQAEWFKGVKNVGVSAGASADPKRVSEFLYAMKDIGLQPDQLHRVTVAEEKQIFSTVRRSNWTKSVEIHL